jgi:hypothetical protein
VKLGGTNAQSLKAAAQAKEGTEIPQCSGELSSLTP